MASKLHTTVSMHYHQWVRVLPTKLTNARPTEWRDTFGHMPATQLVSRHCNPPHASYATKRPGTAGQNTCRNSLQSWHMQFPWKARGPAAFGLDSWRLSISPRISAHLTCIEDKTTVRQEETNKERKNRGQEGREWDNQEEKEGEKRGTISNEQWAMDLTWQPAKMQELTTWH